MFKENTRVIVFANIVVRITFNYWENKVILILRLIVLNAVKKHFGAILRQNTMVV
jgi:hypothetical protein